MMVKDGYKVADGGVIPDEWTVTHVSDLGEVRKGKGISRESIQDRGYPCIRYGEIYTTYNYVVTKVNSYISEEIAQESEPILRGEMLFTGSGETAEDIGKAVVYMLDEPGYAGGDLLILKPNASRVDPLFLSFQWEVENIRSQRRKSGQGASIYHLYADALKKIKVLLPPLPEQQKIADILSTVDEHISETESLIDKTKVLKQGMMQRLLTKGIGHTEFKDTEIGRIPVAWEVTSIGSICTLRGGNGFPDKHQGKKIGKIPYYKVSDMNSTGNEKIMNISNNYIDENVRKELKANLFPENTIIFAKVGAALLLNRRRIIRTPSCIDNNMMGAISGYNVSPIFLYYSMMMIDFGSFVQDGAVPSVNQAQVGEINIALPPLSEQCKIVSTLTSIDDQIDIHQTKLYALTQLKSGLMQQLLTGKIRVKV